MNTRTILQLSGVASNRVRYRVWHKKNRTNARWIRCFKFHSTRSRADSATEEWKNKGHVVKIEKIASGKMPL